MQYKFVPHLGPVFLICLLTAIAFWPGLKGPWVLDDEPNIFKNQQVLLDELTPTQLKIAATAPLASYTYARGLAYLSFALNYYCSDFQFVPFNFKLTNLVFHCINASLVYLILFQVFRASLKNPAYKPEILALIITLCWACHPIQVSTVLYAVQRMTLGSASAVLMGCLAFVKFRTSSHYPTLRLRDTKLLFSILSICLIVGFHFKENIVLLPLFLIPLELIIRGNQKPNPTFDRLILGFVSAIALISIAYISITVGDISSGYIHRNFTLEERLLTQPRALFWYLKLILVPQISDFTLFLDSFPISKSLTQPITTLISIAAWIVLLLIALQRRARALLGTCLLWYLGGHLIESSFLPLEIAFEHRNYLPSIGPITLLILGVKFFLIKHPQRALLNHLLTIMPIIVVTPLCFILSTYWGDKLMFITQQLESQPYSARANGAAGLYYSIRQPLRAIEHFEIAGRHNPTELLPIYSRYSVLMTVYHLYDLSEQAQHSNNTDITRAIREKWTKPALAIELENLEREVEKRLTIHAISSQTMGSLEKATYCALAKLPACRNAETVLAWTELALTNTRKLDHYTPLLRFHRARLLAATGEVEDALTLMETTIREHPSDVYYKIKLAELYEVLEMTDEFNKILQQIPPELLKKYRTKL